MALQGDSPVISKYAGIVSLPSRNGYCIDKGTGKGIIL